MTAASLDTLSASTLRRARGRTSRAILSIARMEWSRIRRSSGLLVCVLVTSALAICTLALTWVRYGTEADVRDRLQDRARQEWVGQPDRHPHRVAHFGSYAFRPIPALAGFDPGVDSFVGRYVFLEAHRRNGASFSDAAQAGAALQFGELTPALILQLVLPLLLICLGFRTISGERESGTWALTMAQGVSPRAVVIGKTLGLAATGAILASIVAAASALTCAALGPLGTDGAERAALLVAAYLFYIVLISALVVALSFAAPRSHAALVAGIALWILGAVALPRAAAMGASTLLPLPTRVELDQRIQDALRSIADSHDPSDPFFAELQRRTLEQYGARDLSELPVNFGGIVMREGERLTSEVYEAHYRALFSGYASQSRLALWLGLGNPLLSLRAVSATLAATDIAHTTDFFEQAEAHRYAFLQRLNEMHASEIAAENDRAQRLGRARWATFPPFQYLPLPLRALAEPLCAPVLALLVWAAAIAIAIAWIPNRWEATR
jgi:ABC-2 type transport system permease protein